MSNDDEDKFPEMDIFLQDLLDARDARGGDDPGDDVDERVEVHAAPGDADGPGIADGELLGGPPLLQKMFNSRCSLRKLPQQLQSHRLQHNQLPPQRRSHMPGSQPSGCSMCLAASSSTTEPPTAW